MTVLESRPILRVRPSAEGPGRSPLAAAAIAAAWAAGCGLLAALALAAAAWFAADTGSFGGAVRVGVLGWLVAQGCGLHIGAVEITAIPLGGCLVAGALLYRAGRWVGCTSRVTGMGQLAGATAVLATTYTGIAWVAFMLTRTESAQADLVRVVVCPLLLAGGFGGFAMLRSAELSDRLSGRLPADVRGCLAGVVAGFCAMVAIGGLTFVASMAWHFSDAVRLAEGLHAGVVGGLILALVGLAAVPNAVLCAGAYVAGPGFLLGADTTVSPFDVQLGPLPAVPVLAAAPHGSGAWWQEALVVLPVLAGGVAGLVTARRCRAEGYLTRAGLAGVSGSGAGLLFGLTTWLATGAIGPGRMQDVGPDVLLTTAVCTAAFTLGAVICVLATTWWADREQAV